MSVSLNATSTLKDHPFIPAGRLDKRSPCPALNALANHGHLPRRGTQITFTQLLCAVRTVYNLSLPLALLLTLVGFLTCAKFSVNVPQSSPATPEHSPYSGYRWRLSVSWTLSLSDLSARGWNKIAHDASLVHVSGIPSHAPDPALLSNLLSTASRSGTQHEAGITLEGLAAVHVLRKRSLSCPLSRLHEQVAVGECALGWLVMRNPRTGVIELDTLEQWFGEERLPEGWWDSKRPVKAVGLIQSRRTAGKVQRLVKNE
ncbi:Chloroperoxidase [Mycena albidolilacea]|uniref:Chloroperoxidase n=1 Tax=Mycena albidolilacea TaxID=1033008 RepID=A0AAD6ZJB0_9AGAR|nr:Chloroperoxidase [Mycena albidolilacea]